MRARRVPAAIVLLGGATLWGCARPQPANDTPDPPERPEAAAPAPRAVPDSTVQRPAPGGGRAAGPPPVGTWVLARGARDESTPSTGLRLTLTVDSTRGPEFFGKVANMFSGNVGIDPRRFRAFRGTLGDDGRMDIAIARTDAAGVALKLAGRLRHDTLHLDLFTLGPDTLTASGEPWYLVRRP